MNQSNKSSKNVNRTLKSYVTLNNNIINGIFTQDNPSVQGTVINGVLLTKN